MADAADSLDGLPDAARMRARILIAFEGAYRECPHGSKDDLRKLFVADFNDRKIPFEDVVYETVGTLSEQKLKRWRKSVIEHGPAGLAPKYGARCGAGVIDCDHELRDFLAAQIAARPHISGAMLIAALRARFKDGRRLPSDRGLQRWAARWKEENKRDLTAIADPDKWRSKYAVAVGSRSEGIVRPNQLWELDSTIGDVLLIDPETNKPKRSALIKCIDVATRRVKMLVARTSTAAAIAALLRRCMIDWGIPESVKTDNGQDYTSRGLETIFQSLEIAVETCRPFKPEEKPHVERAFKTFLHSLVELLPGYVGHNVGERKSIESRRAFSQRLGERDAAIEVSLTPDDFQKICDSWASNLYAHRVHSSLGRSPFAEAAAYEGRITRIADERALDILLLPASGKSATRVVGKKGISILGGHYSDPLLGAMVCETVRVLTDPADLGRVYIFTLDSVFLCEAVNHLRRGISAQKVAVRTKAVQREVLKKSKAKIREEMRRYKVDDVARDVLLDAADSAAKILTGDFRGANEHSTPALEEAGRAARNSDFTAREDSAEEREAKEEVAARLRDAAAAGKAPVLKGAGRVVAFTMRDDTEEERAMKAEVAARLKEIGGVRKR